MSFKTITEVLFLNSVRCFFLQVYKEIKGVKYRVRQIQGSKGNEWRQMRANITIDTEKRDEVILVSVSIVSYATSISR